jgi:ArsR family transcriptional regulator, lead/cadmium/zinc/bismuth-responsive transcriptional repressor
MAARRTSHPLELEQPVCVEEEHARHVRDGAEPEAGAFERAARIFRAMGDVSRLRLLEQLAEGERCVTDLAATSGAEMSTVSQQLRVLRAEDLVITRREGKHVYYALADQHVADLVSSVLAHASEEGSNR